MRRLTALVLLAAPSLAFAQSPAPTPVPDIPPAEAQASAPVEAALPPPDESVPAPPPALPPGFASVAPLGEAPDAKPAVTFQHTAADFKFVALRLDGVEVTELVSSEDGGWAYRPLIPLAGGEHVVEIDYVEGQAPSTARWSFSTTAPPPRPETALGWSLSGEVARIHTEPVGREGTTTNQTLPTIAPNFQGTVTDAEGKLTAGWNATWTQSYDPNNPPQHVSAPAVVVSAQKSVFKATLGNGPLETFAPSTLVQTMSTRRGIELGVDSAYGSLRVYSNIDDGLPSAAGVNEFRQNLYGVSITPNLDSSGRFKLRGLWQYVEDVSDPLYRVPPSVVPAFGAAGAYVNGDTPAQPQPTFFGSTPKKGQLLSASLEYLVDPSVNFLVKAEGVRSYFSTDKNERSLSGDWAWAVTAAASPFGFMLAAGLRTVNDGFGAPANPALIAGRTIWDVAISRGFGALSLSLNYARTNDSGGAGSTGVFQTPEGHADAAAGSVSYNVASTRTGIALSVQQNRARSDSNESKQTNLSLNLSQPVGAWQASLGLLGGRQEASGAFPSRSDTRGATLGVGTQGAVLSIQSSVGVNEAKNVETGEKITSINAMLTPDLNLFDRVVNLTPIGTWARQTTTGGLSDSDSFSYGARLTLRTWGILKGFGLYGQFTESQVCPKAEGIACTKDRRMSAGFAMLLGGGSLSQQIAAQVVTPQGGR